jgi:hypothetical protein
VRTDIERDFHNIAILGGVPALDSPEDGNNFLSHRLARDRSRSPPPQRPKDVFSLGCAHVAIAYPIESPQQRARNAAVIGSGYEPDDIVSMLSII